PAKGRQETTSSTGTNEVPMPEVPFELPHPSLEQYTWVLLDEHGPVCQTPLLQEQAFGPRADTSAVPRVIRVNGYMYMREDAEGGGGPFAGVEPQSREELRRWRTQWQPQVDEVVAALHAFDATSVRRGWGK